MNIFALKLLLRVLPSELNVFLMKSIAVQRRTRSPKLKEYYLCHCINSVTWDSSILLSWLKYQERPFKAFSYIPYQTQTSSRLFSGEKNSSLQIYLRNDATQSCHEMKTGKKISKGRTGSLLDSLRLKFLRVFSLMYLKYYQFLGKWHSNSNMSSNKYFKATVFLVSDTWPPLFPLAKNLKPTGPKSIWRNIIQQLCRVMALFQTEHQTSTDC